MKISLPKITVAASAMVLLSFTPIAASAGVFTGVFDPVLASAATSTAPFLKNSVGLANVLFRIVMGVSIFIMLARYAIKNQTLEGSGHVLMNMFVTMIPMLVILDQAPNFLGRLVEYAGDIANGISPSLSGHSFSKPDEIVEQGWNFCQMMLVAASDPFRNHAGELGIKLLQGDPALFLSSAGLLATFVCCLITMLSYTVIAAQLFLATIQTYLSVSVGAISLGWMGGSGTKGMADAYIGACWQSLMNLVMVTVSVSFVMGMIGPIHNLMDNSTPDSLIGNVLKLSAASVMSALVAWQIPNYARHMFTGHTSTGPFEAMEAGNRAVGTAGEVASSMGSATAKAAIKMNAVARRSGL
jgi:hypothetical protein